MENRKEKIILAAIGVAILTLVFVIFNIVTSSPNPEKDSGTTSTTQSERTADTTKDSSSNTTTVTQPSKDFEVPKIEDNSRLEPGLDTENSDLGPIPDLANPSKAIPQTTASQLAVLLNKLRLPQNKETLKEINNFTAGDFETLWEYNGHILKYAEPGYTITGVLSNILTQEGNNATTVTTVDLSYPDRPTIRPVYYIDLAQNAKTKEWLVTGINQISDK